MNILTQFSIPDLNQAKRVLCIQPHYDDNDIGAGGTLAALHDQGTEVFYLTITNDLIGVVDTQLSDAQADAQLKLEQIQAGEIIGVDWHSWLGCPDAGSYDYYQMRGQIIRYIRLLKPDFLFTCDPWMPYEAHRDHIQAGLATAEASYIHSMLRLKTDPQVDLLYEPYAISGVAFYYTHAPNATVDITSYHERKHRALDCYRAQFTPEDMAMLHQYVGAAERIFAEGSGFEFAESLKVLRPDQLHVNPFTWKM